MIKHKHIIMEPVGLHMRPAVMLVKTFEKYKSVINIKYNDKVAKGTSALRIVTLGATHGDEIVFEMEGPDELATFEELKEVLGLYL